MPAKRVTDQRVQNAVTRKLKNRGRRTRLYGGWDKSRVGR